MLLVSVAQLKHLLCALRCTASKSWAATVPVQESFPDARRLIEAGEMIPDTLVGDLLLEALLLDEPGLQDDLGFVVDGFPRTACQVQEFKHRRLACLQPEGAFLAACCQC